MTVAPSYRRRLALLVVPCLALAGCASAPHISAYQEAMLAPAPRTLALALDRDEPLPLGIRQSDIVAAAEQAGFVVGSEAPARYRLYLSAAVGSAAAGSFLPATAGKTPPAKTPPDWVARPDRSLRARIAGGDTTRVTAILVDAAANREVWRGTGTMLTRDAAASARDLVGQLLAKLPRS